jgi:hypothetical protein
MAKIHVHLEAEVVTLIDAATKQEASQVIQRTINQAHASLVGPMSNGHHAVVPVSRINYITVEE